MDKQHFAQQASVDCLSEDVAVLQFDIERLKLSIEDQKNMEVHPIDQQATDQGDLHYRLIQQKIDYSVIILILCLFLTMGILILFLKFL
jgi:hypothetical protein